MIPTNRWFLARNGQPYHVRDAEPADAEFFIDLINQVGAEEQYIADERATLTVAQQAQLIQARHPAYQCLLVAEMGGRLAGSLEMVRGTLKKNQHTAFFGMALLPEFRHLSIGRGLLLAAEAWAQAVGVEKIGLTVFETNLAARRLYESLGYVEEARRRGQFRIGGQPVDEIWMARWLVQVH